MLCNKKCKRAGKCIYSVCPYSNLNKIRNKLMAKNEFVGPLVNVFIGSFNYPNVNMSVMSDVSKDSSISENVDHWIENDYSINDIVLTRSNVINNSKQNSVKINTKDQSKLSKFSIRKPLTPTQKSNTASSAIDSTFLGNSMQISQLKDNKFISDLQLLSLSKKETSGEIQYNNKIASNLSVDKFTKPTGPKVNLKQFELTENVHVPTTVDKTIDDELNATEGLNKLYKKDFDVYYLTKIFSAGNLGLSKKIVPTKWSITAVDDTLSKINVSKLKSLEVGNDHLVFSGQYMGNYFLIYMEPHEWSYELGEFEVDNVIDLFENHLRKPRLIKLNYGSDYENFYGRKNYATQTAGAYYAARLSIAEKLISMKRQYKVCVFRFITDEYYTPLGVWVVREGVEKSLHKSIKFDTKEMALNYIKNMARKKFRVDIEPYIEESKFFNEKITQKTLISF